MGRPGFDTVARLAVKRAGSIGDALDSRPPVSRAVAAGWAVGKLAACVAASPAVLAGTAWLAARNTQLTRQDLEDYPDSLRRLVEGATYDSLFGAVTRRPARERWFISSDLHRCIPGGADWPRAQGTDEIYAAVLDHYAHGGWGLVENGDVEDFWLVGGSAYGVAYDATRMSAAVTPSPLGAKVRRELYRKHLERIVANNRGIYEQIDTLFHRRGRYVRIVGNHDDVYRDPAMIEALGRYHDDIEVYGALVFDGTDGGVGVVTHGHQTDAWSSGEHDLLGKLLTSVGSALVDLPGTSINPGLPRIEEPRQLFAGAHVDLLTVVDPVFGLNRDRFTVDEVMLFEILERNGLGDVRVVLGHTHLPLVSPSTPDRRRTWSGYVNGGSGLGHRLVSGVEWDGRADPDAPRVSLVAWVWADEDPSIGTIVAERDGRKLARVELRPSATGDTLEPVADR